MKRIQSINSAANSWIVLSRSVDIQYPQSLHFQALANFLPLQSAAGKVS
jgi:hypothetical protein